MILQDNGKEKRFLFLSQLLNRPVSDPTGEKLGKIVDIIAMLSEPSDWYPELQGVVIKSKQEQRMARISAEQFLDIQLKSELICDKNVLKKVELSQKQFLVKDILYDKQIVDVQGAKVERVNDIQICIRENKAYLIQVDVGFTGLSRRLGFERGVRAIGKVFKRLPKDEFISWKYVQPLSEQGGVFPVKLVLRREEMQQLHAGELADIIEDLDRHERLALLRTLEPEDAAEILSETHPKIQTEILTHLDADFAADILEEMEPASAADAIEDLPEDTHQTILEAMETEDREALEILVKAEEGTATSLMTFDFISCPESHTVKQAFQVLRERADDVESIAYIYCVDLENRLAGVVSLRDLIISYENAPLSEIMHPRLATLSADDDWKTVADQFFKYKFRALPVVDPDRHMAGIVTFMHSFEELIPYYHKLID